MGSGRSVTCLVLSELSVGDCAILQTANSTYRFWAEFPDEAIGYFQNTAFLADLSLALERQLARITYLGPLRTYPQRYYIWSGSAPEHVGLQGEDTVEAMHAAGERPLPERENEVVVVGHQAVRQAHPVAAV